MVSGTISLPSRGAFHHSLTVLIHYRSAGSIQAYQVVLADSHKIPRASCYSGYAYMPADTHYDYGTHTLSGQPLKTVRLYACTSTLKAGRPSTRRPTTPATQPLPGITRDWFSPIRFRSPLLTESLHCFLFLSVLRCFTSRRSLQPAYTFNRWSHTITACGVSPFGNPGITARLSTPPGLSQIPTSFIGSCYQGIHHALLNTYNDHTIAKTLKDARVHYAVPKQQPPPPSPPTTGQLPAAGKHYSKQQPHHQPHPTQRHNQQHNAVIIPGPNSAPSKHPHTTPHIRGDTEHASIFHP